jgi:hypothetical protein
LAVENEALLSQHFDFVVDCVIERVHKLLSLNLREDHSPISLIEDGYFDAVKVFIKQEPHKLEKLQSGRLRLISSMSLIDNTISRMLFAQQNSAEVSVHDVIPSKPGLALTDEGLTSIKKAVSAYPGRIAEADVSGWDWSVSEEELQADLERRIRLNGSVGSIWERLARAHVFCVARKVFLTSDGALHSQCIPGVMPSGWYNTSSTNSAIRVLDHHVVNDHLDPYAKGFIIAMGDDSVEKYVEGAVDCYRSIGHNVKMYNEVTLDDFEFCSQRFVGEFAHPVNVSKQLYALLCYTYKDNYERVERLAQFQHEMRHHPKLSDFLGVIEASGW